MHQYKLLKHYKTIAYGKTKRIESSIQIIIKTKTNPKTKNKQCKCQVKKLSGCIKVAQDLS
jgi:hypothetical protein